MNLFLAIYDYEKNYSAIYSVRNIIDGMSPEQQLI
jgi:hypothetical protein